MKARSRILGLCAACIAIASCEGVDETLKPQPVDWEGNAPLFNEAYRDSVVVKTSRGMALMFRDGTGLRIVGKTPIQPTFVSWSPRKWKVLYGLSNALYFMNSDGTKEQLVATSRDYLLHAMMSPDGQSIAYIAIDTTDPYFNKGKIKLMNPDGTNVRELTSRIIGPNSVAWTSDSRYVIYSSQDSSYGGIDIISVEGTGHRFLYHNTYSSCDNPSMSPDGTTLAFTTAVGGVASRVVLLDIRSPGLLTALTRGTSNEFQPSWSTDGRQLLFCCNNNGTSLQMVWKIDVDGQNLVCTTQAYQMVFSRPCWFR